MNMLAFIALIGLASTLAHGGPCDDLGGVWRNALGSNMSVVTSSDRPYVISGAYSTSVESKPGAAAFSSPIAGVVKPVDGGGSLVSWNVLWSGGKSMTTWVGQCMECEGREIIFTTWALRSLQTPLNKWMTTRVNQDTFWRLSDEQPSLPPVNISDGVNGAVLGRWTSISGDALNITFAAKKGKLEGDHLTPVKGEEEVDPVAFFGATDGRHNYTALGFSSAGPTSVRGWTGHIYDPQEAHPVLETSWLAHSFSGSCNDPRRFVSYGMDNYTQPIEQH